MLTLSIIVAGALVWLSAIVQHIGNLTGIGAKWVMSDPSQAVRDDGFVGRSARTLKEQPRILRDIRPQRLDGVRPASIVIRHRGNSRCRAAARVVFTLCYWLKINTLGSLSWLVGMICIAAMAALALQATILPPA